MGDGHILLLTKYRRYQWVYYLLEKWKQTTAKKKIPQEILLRIS